MPFTEGLSVVCASARTLSFLRLKTMGLDFVERWRINMMNFPCLREESAHSFHEMKHIEMVLR